MFSQKVGRKVLVWVAVSGVLCASYMCLINHKAVSSWFTPSSSDDTQGESVTDPPRNEGHGELALQTPDHRHLNFIVFGDWGSAGEAQRRTAAAMDQYSSEHDSRFLVNVGDNFYKDAVKGIEQGGVTHVEDPVWTTLFEEVYGGNLENLPFYSILGNHDYRGNVTAQLLYHQLSSRWVMPTKSYVLRVSLHKTSKHYGAPASKVASFVFLDTSPCISRYYKKPENPLQLKNLKREDCAEQLEWFERVLKKARCDSEFVFVVGHHPVILGGSKVTKKHRKEVKSIRKIMHIVESHNVDAYFSGHVHKLEYTRKHGVHYVLSGSSSLGKLAGAQKGKGVQGKMKEDNPKYKEGKHWSSPLAGFVGVDVDARGSMIINYYDQEQNTLQSFHSKARGRTC